MRDEEQRPDPDLLLEQIQRVEKKKNGRGKLKIFFGYAAGVGKTYAMLEYAHAALEEGVDMVVGYIEPHTRPDTMEMIDGLEVLPPLALSYKGITLKEFDLDGALKRKPQLILVDELAHTNGPGKRHTKRYNDIEELLDSGIDVWTTVNVQHIESLNDIVSTLTGVVVKERVPDRIFEQSAQIELLDIDPAELEARLEAGKIYQGEKAKHAGAHFFVRENLDALREIALRYTADHVNKEMESKKSTNEHILVCLGSTYSNAKVVRSAARMADSFHSQLTAIYVETPKSLKQDEDSLKRIRENMKLAESLGAKIIHTHGSDVAFQIAQFAKVSGVSKIIIGRTRRKFFIFSPRQNFVDRLIDLARDIDIYVIPDQGHGEYKKKASGLSKPKVSAKDLGITIGVLSIFIALCLFFYQMGFEQINMITVLILGVLVISYLTKGIFCGVLASILGVIGFNFLFTEPRFTLNVDGPNYPITFMVMLTAAIITTTLTTKVQEQANASALNAYWTGILLDTSRELQKADTAADIAFQAQYQLFKFLDSPIVIYTAENGTIDTLYNYKYEDGTMLEERYTSREEQGVASWVMKNKKPAGIFTDTLPGSLALYRPVLGGDNAVLAVVGIILKPEEYIDPSENVVLTAMLNQVAFALEKHIINQAQKTAQTQAENERFKSSILRAVSHDLRTPLTSISGSANALLFSDLSEETKKSLTMDIYDDSLWLIGLVENLLAISRIDHEKVELRMQPELAEEIVTEALLHVNRKSKDYHIKKEIENDFIMVQADAKLMMQVIVNIVDNAIHYTPRGSHIAISVKENKGRVHFEISDDGNGISEKDKNSIFDLFFTADGNPGDSRRGLGLGLALCKSIIAAHQGEIYVKNNRPKGTIFGFTLTSAEVKHDENIHFGH